VRNRVGNGSAYYYGAVFNLDAVTALIDRLGLVSPVGAWLELPQPIELCIRAHPQSGERLIFLLNYSAAGQTIVLHKEATDALSGAQLNGTIIVEPFGVRILSDTDGPTARG
jgi:beta-galactosidase